MTRRLDRLNGLLRQEISDLLNRELKDPRLNLLISILQVEISQDLEKAKVYISIMASHEQKEQAIDALNSAAGFLRRELRHRLTLKKIPELHFFLDESIERGAHLLQLIKEVTPQQSPKEP